jgi:hypothetical protein
VWDGDIGVSKWGYDRWMGRGTAHIGVMGGHKRVGEGESTRKERMGWEREQSAHKGAGGR